MQVSTLLKSGQLTLEQLKESPYYLKVKTVGPLTVLNYCQINSPEHNNIVKECRGLILDEKFNPVSVGFYRFSNFNDKLHKLDWTKFRAYDKLDGSIIMLYYFNGAWKFATRSNPEADGFILQSKTTFTELLKLATSDTALKDLSTLDLDTQYTYIFELTSDLNTIVTKYSVTKLSLLSARHNTLGTEVSFVEADALAAKLNVARPTYRTFTSYAEAKAYLRTLPITFEGFVLTEEAPASPTGHYRLKLKSPAYVALHHLKGEVTSKNILQVLLQGEKEELVSSLPDHAAVIESLASRLKQFKSQFETSYSVALAKLNEEVSKNPTLAVEAQKQIFARALGEFPHKNLAFACFTGKLTIDELLYSYDSAKLLKQI